MTSFESVKRFERVKEIFFCVRHQRAQQVARKLPSDRRSDLSDVFCFSEPVQTRGQRVAKRARDRQLGQRPGELETVVTFGELTRLDDRTRQLLDEQWAAVRFVEDVLHELLRQGLPAGDVGNDASRLIVIESVQVDRRAFFAGPRCVKRRPRSHEYQDRMPIDPVDRAVEQLESSGVHPMQVFENQ